MQIPPAQPDGCSNCGAAMIGPYCAQCGQMTPRANLTLRELLHEAAHELASWEGKVPNTLKVLFLQPGRLTLDFLAGRRARWLSPLRLYLICSVAFFLSGPFVEAVTHRSDAAITEIGHTRADGSITLTPEVRQEIAQSLPGRLFGPERMERAIANRDKFNSAISSAYPKAMFVLLPLFALLTNIAWRRKLPLYPAHIYLALHLHAAAFGAFALVTVATIFFSSNAVAIIMGVTAFPYIVWYGLTAFRRVFGDTWAMTIAKTAVVVGVYFACLFAVSLTLLAYALATT